LATPSAMEKNPISTGALGFIHDYRYLSQARSIVQLV